MKKVFAINCKPVQTSSTFYHRSFSGFFVRKDHKVRGIILLDSLDLSGPQEEQLIVGNITAKHISFNKYDNEWNYTMYAGISVERNHYMGSIQIPNPNPPFGNTYGGLMLLDVCQSDIHQDKLSELEQKLQLYLEKATHLLV